jgi:uncharacterized protein
MVAVTVVRLGLDGASNSPVVVLREVGGRRFLPIWIGTPEAEAIVVQMNQVKRERPMTHDLCKTIIGALGGTLRRVNIHRVHNNTYFASLFLERGTDLVQIDARPSDSIAIALRFEAPIFVEGSLLIAPDDDTTDDLPPSASPSAGHEMTTEELQVYLATLRPEDFGKFHP